MVDLPGLTKVAVGDQPDNIEYMIREMILTYIQPDNTIILAVTPANQDLANSDALKLAKFVDKEGDRTIGVITKLDLMDQGTDARDVLLNKILPLQKGYVGVVNRSQRDIDSNLDIKKAWTAEKEFFLKSPYKSMIAKMGNRYLQRFLHKELSNHIRSKLPEIKSEIFRKNRDINDELKSLGYDEKRSSDSTGRIYHLLNSFVDELKFSIDGSGDNVLTKDIKGGFRIRKCFYEEFDQFFNNGLDFTMDTLEREIGLVISNLNGVNNALFVPHKAFELIVKMLLKQYEVPVENCVHKVGELMEEILTDSIQTFDKFPNLRLELLKLVGKEIDENEKIVTEQLLLYINAQKSFLNTQHPSMKDPLKKESLGGRSSPQKQMSTGEDVLQPLPQDFRQRSGTASSGSRSRKSSIIHIPSQSELNIMWDKVNVEFSGKLTIVGLGSTKMVKEANCVLSNTNNQFSFTISERSFLSSREIKETVSLENVVCESSLSSGGSRIFVLKNRNDEAVLKNYMTVEMSATTENADYWVRAFTSFGIFKDTNENILVANMLAKVEDTPVRKVSVPKTKLEITLEEILKDSKTKDHIKSLTKYIEEYMKVVDMNIRDITPKYIMLTLGRYV